MLEIASLLHIINAQVTDENASYKDPAEIPERILICCLCAFADILPDLCLMPGTGLCLNGHQHGDLVLVYLK